MTPLLAPGLRPDRSFERIYKRHVGDVYRYALAVLRNPADAEDVTQTTFMNAYRAYSAGERPRQPQNWLIAIAHNVCRQRFRQAQRRPHEVAYDENVGEWLEDDDRGPTAQDLQRALSHLAFNQRAALVMRELEGRSYAEIGEILGLTVAAVETLIFRARRALREQLEGALTCAEAERALSLEADGRLPRHEKGQLRAHLRECKECAAVARRQRAQRSAWKALGALPVPASLSSLFGGGGAVLGVKAAAVAASALAAGGLGLAGERHLTSHPAKAKRHPAARPVHAEPRPVVAAVVARTPARPVAAVAHPTSAVPHRSSAAAATHRRSVRAAAGNRVHHGRGASAKTSASRVQPAQAQRAQSRQTRGRALGQDGQKHKATHGKALGHVKHASAGSGAVAPTGPATEHRTKARSGPSRVHGASGGPSASDHGQAKKDSPGQDGAPSAADTSPVPPDAALDGEHPGNHRGQAQVSP